MKTVLKRVPIVLMLSLAFLLAVNGLGSRAAAQGPCGDAVVVVAGDTLTRIANRCNTTVQAIVNANPEIENPNLIYVGQRLAMPGAEEPEPPSSANVHVVQPGDTLHRIAVRYSTTVEAILEANPDIENRNLIYVGQRLAIPGTQEGAQVIISPSSGPPGTVIDVSASGFPANTTVQVGAGRVNTEFGLETDVQTGADGTLTTEIVLPEFAEAGTEWVVVVRVVGGEPKATSTPFQVTSPPGPGTARANIYLVALGDAGQSGREFGCNDSLVPVEVVIQDTNAPLRAVLQELLAIREQSYGQSGLYNALYRSELALDEVTISDGTAMIRLSGNVMLGGECDVPRVQEQLRETALQFDGVDQVEITINGQPLDEALSLR